MKNAFSLSLNEKEWCVFNKPEDVLICNTQEIAMLIILIYSVKYNASNVWF